MKAPWIIFHSLSSIPQFVWGIFLYEDMGIGFVSVMVFQVSQGPFIVFATQFEVWLQSDFVFEQSCRHLGARCVHLVTCHCQSILGRSLKQLRNLIYNLLIVLLVLTVKRVWDPYYWVSKASILSPFLCNVCMVLLRVCHPCVDDTKLWFVCSFFKFGGSRLGLKSVSDNEVRITSVLCLFECVHEIIFGTWQKYLTRTLSDSCS